MNLDRLRHALILLAAVAPLLGSSATLCSADTGDPAVPDIYNRGYDQTHDYLSRWFRGNEQLTPHWSPNGSHIVFGHAGRIYVVGAEGSDLKSLSGSFEPVGGYSETAEIDFSPSISPDGSQVAYTTLRYASGELYDHTYEIATQSIEGSEPRRLTANDRDDVSPAWSPNGSRIAFVSIRDGASSVFTIAPDGTDERSHAPSVSAKTDAPLWSPDGRRLAFVGVESETTDVNWLDTYDSRATPTPKVSRQTIHRETVYVANADGSDLTKLEWSDSPNSEPRTRVGVRDLSSPEEDVGPFRWSPDGSRVAFVARHYGERDGLYTANHDGSDVRRIYHLSDALGFKRHSSTAIRGIAWSPDGSHISLEVSGHLRRGDVLRPVGGVHALSADGSDLRKLMHRDNIDVFLEWPGAVARASRRLMSTSFGNYLQWAELFRQTGPVRLVRYTDSEGGKGWVLSAVSWDGSVDNLLVRVVEGRVVPANPSLSQTSDAPSHCSNGLVVPNPEKNSGLVSDCRTLLSMRDALEGDGVLYWSSDTPIHKWPGVTVAGSTPRVHAVSSVPGVPLTGTIPPYIGQLAELRQIDLAGNELSGSLPAELGNLARLEILNLSRNALEGPIPSELGRLERLEELYLQRNPLRGHIPPELGSLHHLRILHLGGNLTGTIPPELGDLEHLTELSIKWTQLSGVIPTELGKLSKLRKLILRGNPSDGGGLTGPILLDMANLRNLTELDLGNNRLKGHLPPELGDLVEPSRDGYRSRLRYVNLRGNLFLGCVPKKLALVPDFYADIPFCR